MVFLVLCATPVLAASPSLASVKAAWTEYPVYRGEMTAITEDPGSSGTFYVGTLRAGVFKSTDGGATWQPSRGGLTRSSIISLAIDPMSSSNVLAGSDGDGIWRSSNGGGSWLAASGIELDMEISAIVYHPLTTSIVYAASESYSEGNVYKSIDGGVSWFVSDNGMPGSAGSHTDAVLCLALDAADPGHLYAGTASFGVYHSTDGGATWSALCSGLPNDGGDYSAVTAIAVNPHDGQPWAVVSYSNGLYRLDETDTWVLVSDELWTGDHLDFMPDDANTMFATGGLSGSCEKSVDGGVNWSRSLGHPDSGSVSEIAFHSTLPDELLAAASEALSMELGGVYRSSDRGVSWSLSTQGITAAELRSVAVDPADPQHLLTGTSSGGLLVSEDGGQTWARAYEALNPGYYSFGFETTDIVVDPADGQWVYLAAGSLWASNDGGESFGNITEGDHAQCLAAAPGTTTTIYAGRSFGNGMLRGSAGSGWEVINNGLPSCFLGVCDPVSLAVDPNDPLTVWTGMAGSGGIAKTSNGGDSWTVMGLTSSYRITAVMVSPASSLVILAADDSGRIYHSTNGGASWQLRHDGDNNIYAFVTHPDEPSWVYAASNGDGVLRSTNGGQTWSAYSNGIFYTAVIDLDVSDEREPLLLAPSDGSGLYGRRLPVVVDIFSDGFESGDLSRWSVID
jgi:photosystem II stability/assembly factor-like uncharacterized protein